MAHDDGGATVVAGRGGVEQPSATRMGGQANAFHRIQRLGRTLRDDMICGISPDSDRASSLMFYTLFDAPGSVRPAKADDSLGRL